LAKIIYFDYDLVECDLHASSLNAFLIPTFYYSYLELPLRLAQMRLVSSVSSRQSVSLRPSIIASVPGCVIHSAAALTLLHGTDLQGSLKGLAWLLGFRISLLLYYAGRVRQRAARCGRSGQ
jgi:hypothetical protein